MSRTLRSGRGSCSQRFAVLEATARCHGIATRSRGLLVSGSFWYPRFPRSRWAVPEVVVLAWPEFLLGDQWASVSEVFEASGRHGGPRFTNDGGETLFGAAGRTHLRWSAPAPAPGACTSCDLSAEVVADLGTFESRDALFAARGATLSRPARWLLEPVLGRWASPGHVSPRRARARWRSG